MNYIAQIEIFCIALNFHLIKSNETIYVKHDDYNETTTQEQPKQIDNNQLNQHDPVHPEPEPIDHYTFVVLIEIMFNDGSRKYCTGTIIHDSVVITAAHCFEKEFVNSVEAELTGSFVIIGTKEMFDTGYEKYLPIERVLIHPDYKGWNADLALIYTFAGMMSDKPGDMIPLAEQNSYTPLYGNVTVLQWNIVKQKRQNIPLLEFGSSQSSEEEEIFFEKEVTRSILSSNDLSKEVAKESTLFMEEYTIFETDSCKNLVKKLQPDFYQIESINKTVCFFTKNSNKVQGNSGAPAVHRNHLIAIAAGDISHNSEHVIVATKLNCFCRWIRDNLPPSVSTELQYFHDIFLTKIMLYFYLKMARVSWSLPWSGGEKLKCCTSCCPEMSLKYRREIYF